MLKEPTLQTTLALLGTLMIIATLLPLARLDDWWVRIFDFPRLQIAAVSVVVLGLGVFLREDAGPLHSVWLALLAACALYQGWRMLPYTRLHAKEVQDSEGADAAATISLLCANVLMGNRSAEGLCRLIEENDPDLILAAEPDAWWQQALRHLEISHPHTVQQPQGNTYGLLLYSRLALVDARVRFLVEGDVPSIHARVRLRSGQEIELRCLHPRPPAPGESSSSADRDAELMLVGKEIKALKAPALVCGDMNDVAWSHTNDLFCKVSGLLDPRIGRGFFHTFNSKWPLVRFPLDHVFHSTHFRLVAFRRLRHWGSDHFPVFIKLSFEPDAQATQDEPEPDAEEQQEAQEKIGKAA
ncbi:MAG: endonuclease/exonuclease/phosphatase family protein [Roseateles sp.]|uniref:endonuclease/exonuclease/phosphatase family protein n=1 Tax=Roseateles sp. TaxID=1971397 RepID=UPI0040363D4A